MSRVFRLRNECSEVARFHPEFSGYLSEEGVGEELIHDALLVSEEVLVNTILHGYGEPPRLAWIDVEVEVPQVSRILITLKDDGLEFNPLEAEERDLSEERLGGWGLPLLQALTRKVEYKRESGFNILSLECASPDA